MTTTDLIKFLEKHEFGASGRARELSFNVLLKNGNSEFLPTPEITLNSTGDGIAGSEICLNIKTI